MKFRLRSNWQRDFSLISKTREKCFCALKLFRSNCHFHFEMWENKTLYMNQIILDAVWWRRQCWIWRTNPWQNIQKIKCMQSHACYWKYAVIVICSLRSGQHQWQCIVNVQIRLGLCKIVSMPTFEKAHTPHTNRLTVFGSNAPTRCDMAIWYSRRVTCCYQFGLILPSNILHWCVFVAGGVWNWHCPNHSRNHFVDTLHCFMLLLNICIYPC